MGIYGEATKPHPLAYTPYDMFDADSPKSLTCVEKDWFESRAIAAGWFIMDRMEEDEEDHGRMNKYLDRDMPQEEAFEIAERILAERR